MSDADAYTGHVEPGGPASVRTIAVDGRDVEIRKLSVGPTDNNAYLLTDTASGQALLIDAANDANRLLAEVGDRTLVAVLTTHGHPDHWQALQQVVDATGAAVVIHPADQHRVPVPATRPAEDGMALPFGGAAVRLLHTPGHTEGSVCALLGEHHLFTGDTLFPGGPGATSYPGGDFPTIMRSLQDKLFVLDDETWVYPGHGDDTTLGAERPHLEEWRERGW